MGLVKARGNMYPFVDYTWNPIKGRCKMECPYCYVQHSRAKRFYQDEPYLSEKELKTNLGIGNFIFVGSMTDVWGNWIASEWIRKILEHCKQYDNKYLFQSKNPKRFWDFEKEFPEDIVLGTTLENDSKKCASRSIFDVPNWMHEIPKMISIEPIMDIKNLTNFILAIMNIEPSFVVIGADSKGHNLPEPPEDNIKQLVDALKKNNINVILKKNLKRLAPSLFKDE